MRTLDYDNFLLLIFDEPFLDYPKFLNNLYRNILKKDIVNLNDKDIGIYFYDFDFAAHYNLNKKSIYNNKLINNKFIEFIKNKNNSLKFFISCNIEYEVFQNSYQQKQFQYESSLSETYSFFLINHKFDFLDVLNFELKQQDLLKKNYLYYHKKINNKLVYKYNNNYSYLNNKYL